MEVWGSHLENGEAGVGVFDGWHAAVGVNGLVGVFLHIGVIHHLVLVLEAKFLEDDGDLPWVGALG